VQSKTPSLVARLRFHEPGRPKQTTRSLKPINQAVSHTAVPGRGAELRISSIAWPRGFNTGDLCPYWTVSDGRVLCRVIRECGDTGVVLMAADNSRIYDGLNESLRSVGDGERTRKRSSRDRHRTDGPSWAMARDRRCLPSGTGFRTVEVHCSRRSELHRSHCFCVVRSPNASHHKGLRELSQAGRTRH
jgi:hypothetical protein